MPPLPPTAEAEKAPERTEAFYKEKLTDFYKTHNPERLLSVDETLASWKGRENLLFETLATKYKVANPIV